MAHRWPEADEALRDDDGRGASSARAIEAVQELRGWRDRVGAAPGSVAPGAARRPRATSAPPTHVARLARVEWTADGGEPVATVGVPGGNVAVLASDAVDLEAEARARRRARATQLEAEIARAEGKLANEGFVAKAPRGRRRRPSATSSRGCRRSWRSSVT